MRYRKSPDVDQYLHEATPPISRLLVELRELIHASVPNTGEAIKWNIPVFSTDHNFCYLRASKDYATLGFYDGSRLTDTVGLLEGRGVKLRHVKIRSAKDIRDRLFADWLKTASQ